MIGTELLTESRIVARPRTPPANAPIRRPGSGGGRLVRGFLLIGVVTLATHGLALFDGVVLDDYWHQKGLREHGWSFSGLMRTLDITPSDFLETWWQTREVKWHYLRPFFIVCMKFVYTVMGDGSPVALHAFSLLLHFVSALLVWRLCWMLTQHASLSIIGGILFAIYSHSPVTVAWPSAQNVVIQTTLLLATMLCYLRASGLNVGPKTWTARRAPQAIALPRLLPFYTALTFSFWLAAIFTRENAILLPAILGAFELSFGGIERLWGRRRIYFAFFLVGCAFVVWREWMGISPLPDVYCQRANGNWVEYLPWLAAKFLHYLTVSIWVAPMTIGPTGRYQPWRDVPGDCLLMLGIVAFFGVLYFLAARRARGWWIWPLWIVLSVLPVLAVVATPHSGYMSGVGFAVGLVLACAAVLRFGSRHLQRVTLITAAVSFLGTAFMTPVNRLQWMATYAAERYLPAWVMVSPPTREVRDVFFLNLPFANVYVKPNLVARLGDWFEDVNCHVLTWSPQALEMSERTILEQEDAYRFTISVEGQAYFSRFLGRFVLEAFRGKERFEAGQTFSAREFDVTILEADSEGVWKLRFTFRKPLSDPSYCFYLTSRVCGAARIHFSDTLSALEAPRQVVERANVPSDWELELSAGRLRGGRAEAALPLFAAVLSGPAESAAKAQRELRPIVEYMATALGAKIAAAFDTQEPTAEVWRQVAEWWTGHVDDRALSELWLHRHDFDDLRWLRYEIEWDRIIAGQVIRTDLYLTGPPYDGPRGY